MRNLALVCSLILAAGAACGEDPSQPLPDAGVSDAGFDDSGSAEDSGTCPSNDGCAEVDATRCGSSGLERCVSQSEGCLVWTAESCAGACVEGRCHECAGGAGTFAEQSIDVDGETRFYFLHVPASYRCEAGAPLWIDFHGTAGDLPEEAYRTPELVAVSDREGAIVVRPRSRFSQTDFGRVYRWDQNPGDIARNVRFTGALIETLSELYHLDLERRYASGFSSGANMAAQFFGSNRDEFRGVAMVGGGYWANPQIGALAARDLRVYAVTGYRDYLIGTLLPLLPELADHGLPSDRLFFRQTDSGHELYGWQLGEIFAWLDRGERPPNGGGLGPEWSIDPSIDTTDTLIQLEVTAAGDLLAASDRGAIHRFSNGGWSTIPLASNPITGLCVLPTGRGMAVGAHAIGLTDDYGATWSDAPPAPELSGQYFGAAYLNDVACIGGDSIVAAGYWSGVRSDDRAASYRAANLELDVGIPAQVSAIAVSTASSAVATGYFYLGRSDDAEHFTSVGLPPGVEWLNDVTSADGGLWWVAGEAGTVARSIDDGFTWTVLDTGSSEDLYAIDFYDGQIGLAVGLHGAALFTEDGGDNWRDVSIGYDRFLGDVRWIDPVTAVVVGEGGAVLRFAR